MLVESVTGWLVPAGIWLLLTRLPAHPPSGRTISVAIFWDVVCAVSAAAGALMVYTLAGDDGSAAGLWIGLAAGIAASGLLVNPRPVLRLTNAVTAAVAASFIDIWLDNGWLTHIGASASLGHGAIDLFRLGSIGVIAGVAALCTNAQFPQPAQAPRLPAHMSWVRTAGALGLLCAGQLSLALDNRAFSSTQISGQTVTLLSAFAAAVAYSIYTTGRVRLPMLTRAIIAGTVAASASALLPGALPPAIGVLATLCAIPVNAWVQTRSGIRDPHGAFGMFLAPGLLGLAATGLFASGALLSGWAGVGAESYLNTEGLGVVGWLVAGDIGQFSAQVLLALTALASTAAPTALAVDSLKRVTPSLTIETLELSSETGIAVPAPAQAAKREHLDGDSLQKPKRALPHTRAYKVAYPFSKRARQNRITPDFVVREDTPVESEPEQKD
jgi:hypothetical protein